jgi:SSS family solute:Na+ symporter
MSYIDIAVIAAYLIVIVSLGCYAGLRSKQYGAAQGYFLASHALRWPAIGLALFATNISTVHVISLAQAGYDNGLLMGNFEWMAGFTLIALSLFFVPFYIRAKVTTLPDFLEKRYNRACRDWLTVISVVSAIVLHIAFPLAAGWVVLHHLIGIDKWTCILMICGLTALYTSVGGLAAVVLTEAVQAIVLLLGAILITAFAYSKAGGWNAMVTTLEHAQALDKLSMLRSGATEKDLPWFAIFLGYPVLGIWYWCADQTIVQRVLGAKDEQHARLGPLFCAVLKILPVFLFVLPGLLFYVIVQQGAYPGAIGNSKEVYGAMIEKLLPSHFFGILVAALMAALMSNLASAANSIATLFTYDIWKRFRPQAPEPQLVLLGRSTTLVSFAIGIALVPMIENYESIFIGINDVISHLAPPITCVFLLGVFWPKASARAAQWTMWLGSSLGAFIYLLKTLHTWKPDLFSWIPGFVYLTPFMMLAFYLFAACIAGQIALSIIYPKQPWEDPSQLSWAHPLAALKLPGWAGAADYRLVAAGVFVMLLTLYATFK